MVVDSALWEGAVVDRGARVESSIVATGVVIPENAEISNALVCSGEAGVEVVAIDPSRPVERVGV